VWYLWHQHLDVAAKDVKLVVSEELDGVVDHHHRALCNVDDAMWHVMRW